MDNDVTKQTLITIKAIEASLADISNALGRIATALEHANTKK